MVKNLTSGFRTGFKVPPKNDLKYPFPKNKKKCLAEHISGMFQERQEYREGQKCEIHMGSR